MRLDHLFTSLDSSRVCGQSTIALQNIQSSKSSSFTTKCSGTICRRSPYKRRAGGTPDTKFPGGHRSRVTPVPIPNTEVKPATADGTARAGGWESRSLPGINHQSPSFNEDGLFLLRQFSQLDSGILIALLMTMRTCSASFALILLLSAFASACSDSPTSPSTASAASSSSNVASSSSNVAAQLEGGWTLTSIQPAGLPRQDRPAEAPYSITFSDGRLSTRADCNVCNGSFSVRESTLTAASVLACTRAACPTMEFESAYTRLLSGDSNIVITGNTLTLSSARGVLTFTR